MDAIVAKADTQFAMVPRSGHRPRRRAARRLSDRARHRDFQAARPLPLSAERLHSRLCRRQREGAAAIGSICCPASPISISSRPQQQRQNADANYRPLIYQLDERGSRVLRERGLPFLPKSYHHNFAHELMVAQITASIELGTRENARRPAHHLAGDLGATNTRPTRPAQSATPAAIRVSYSLRGEPRSRRDQCRRPAVRAGAHHRRQAELSVLSRHRGRLRHRADRRQRL